MRRAAWIAVLLAALPAMGLARGEGAATGQIVASDAPVPGPSFAPGWVKVGAMRAFTGQDLFNQIDGGAELFLEFGFIKLRLQAYARGKAELTLNAYEMESAASALGIYLMKMGRETPFAEIKARNSSEDAQMTILKGRWFVQVDNMGDEPAGRSEAVALANAFLAGIPDEAAVSPLASLPREDIVPGSERWVRGPYGLQPYFTFGEGDILSQGGKVFGALAEYKSPGGETCSRLIVRYPTPEAAAAALAYLRANLDPYLKITAERPDGFDYMDFQSKKGSVVLKNAQLDLRFKVAS